MRATYKFAVSVLLVVSGIGGTQCAQAQTVPQNSDVEKRLGLLERKLEQLEQRVNAAVPASVEAAVSDDRLEALDQKLRILERNRELEQEGLAAKAKQTPVVAAGKDGFSLQSADKSFQLKVGGYVHADGRFFPDDNAHVGTDNFVLRRVRPVLQGTVFQSVDFRIMPDFGEGKSVLQDAYIDFRYFPLTVLRAGKFKGPVGLERLQSATDILFAERALPTNLVPNRDLGLQVWGDIAGRVNYAVGVFNGAPDGGSVDGDTNDGKDFAARLFLTPFAKSQVDHPLRGLGFGAAVTTGRQEGSVLPSFKSSGQSTFFSYSSGVLAAGRRLRYSPQAYFYYGPLGLLGEYVQSNQQVAKGTSQAEIANHAWQVSASYFLTGEKNGYKHSSPRHNFEGRSGGAGAWELAARFSDLAVDQRAFTGRFADPAKSASSANAWAIGLNWYLNKYAKLVFDYEQTHFQGGALNGDRPTEKAFFNRLQIAF
ncbi:MAG: porin [Terriglobales bacterium]